MSYIGSLIREKLCNRPTVFLEISVKICDDDFPIWSIIFPISSELFLCASLLWDDFVPYFPVCVDGLRISVDTPRKNSRSAPTRKYSPIWAHLSPVAIVNAWINKPFSFPFSFCAWQGRLVYLLCSRNGRANVVRVLRVVRTGSLQRLSLLD